ncbi:hypothetical protein QQS21_006989 [Conoideocrella luteorostrata]|uniref:Uncharacterized protein n=1 Tax=Conoideocrella luteorostrata TaxID=1105319 RepID=A0AAJ0FXF9_9HYPO|nr:hypothetical protein QQS21_006989 [Conoideocrella luteorostrata]
MDKILEINWRSRFGTNVDKVNELIEGTNGATVGKMKSVNDTIRVFMSVAIVPVFAGAGLAVLILGEINFFSKQMRYQNEPMASIGQWGPIVGTGIAIVGSLYLLLAADIDAVLKKTSDAPKECGCKCQQHRIQPSRTLSSRCSRSKERDVVETSSPPQVDHCSDLHHETSNRASSSLHETDTHGESGSRHKVASTLIAIAGALGSATHDSFDLTKFRDGAALDFPEIPGEKERNRNLAHIKDIYSKRLEEDGTPAVLASRSRASSFTGAGPSGHVLDSLRPSRDASPRPGGRSPSPLPSSSRPRASTLPVDSGTHELLPVNSLPASVDLNRGRQRYRRDTLEVPVATHLRPPRESSPSMHHEHAVVSTSATPDHQPHPLATTTTMTNSPYKEEPERLISGPGQSNSRPIDRDSYFPS